MKRFLTCVLLTLFTITAACSSTPKESLTAADAGTSANASDTEFSQIPDVEKALETSDQALHTFRHQSWDKHRSLYPAKLAKKLTNDAMKTAWEQTIPPLGTFQKILYRYPIVQNHHLKVINTALFENGAVAISTSFNKKGKLEGFFFVNGVKTESLASCPKDCTSEIINLADAFRNGDWTKFNALYDTPWQEEKLNQWRNDVLPIGRLISLINATEGEKPNEFIYNALHEKGTLKLSVEFLENGKAKSFHYDTKLSQNDGNAPGTQLLTEEPQDPFAPQTSELWTESEITVTAKPEFPNKGLLTLPKNVEKPPVVILVHGTGCNDMNETITVNHPFLDIAHDLAAKGVAVMRYHKRCYTHGDKTGQDMTGTIQTHVLEDVDAAIELAKKDDRLDSSRIYVLGHSLGANLLPYIASIHPEIAGGIVMAGSLKGSEDSMYRQFQEISAISPIFTPEKQAELESEYKQLKDFDNVDPQKQTLLGISVEYWKTYLPLTGSLHIDKVQPPLLVLQGDKDVQIYPDIDFPPWQEAAQKYPNIECHLLPNVSHLFLPVHVTGTQRQDYINEYDKPQHVVPEAIDLIVQFVAKSKK